MDNNKYNYDVWTINGRWLSHYGVIPMSEMADSLDMPANFKSVTTDDNDGIDGCIGLFANRKKKKRDFTLKLYVNTGYDNIVMANQVVDNFLDELAYGENGSGISNLQTESRAYRIVPNNVEKRQIIGAGKFILHVSVMEVNPTNNTRDVLTTWSLSGSEVLSSFTPRLFYGAAVTTPGSYFVKLSSGTYNVTTSNGRIGRVVVTDGTVVGLY